MTAASCSAGRSDRRWGQMFTQQTPEPGRSLRLWHLVHPALEQSLALGVDEDIRPPQRVLDELELFLRASCGHAADVAEVRGDLVVRPALGVAEERGVAADRAQSRAVNLDRRGTFGGGAGRRRRPGGQARSLEELDEQIGPVGRWRDEAFAEIGEALTDEAFRGVDEEERRLEEVPLAAYCPACAAERVLPSVLELCCPVCGVATPEVVSGRELEIVALEIEA